MTHLYRISQHHQLQNTTPSSHHSGRHQDTQHHQQSHAPSHSSTDAITTIASDSNHHQSTDPHHSTSVPSPPYHAFMHNHEAHDSHDDPLSHHIDSSWASTPYHDYLFSSHHHNSPVDTSEGTANFPHTNNPAAALHSNEQQHLLHNSIPILKRTHSVPNPTPSPNRDFINSSHYNHSTTNHSFTSDAYSPSKPFHSEELLDYQPLVWKLNVLVASGGTKQTSASQRSSRRGNQPTGNENIDSVTFHPSSGGAIQHHTAHSHPQYLFLALKYKVIRYHCRNVNSNDFINKLELEWNFARDVVAYWHAQRNQREENLVDHAPEQLYTATEVRPSASEMDTQHSTQPRQNEQQQYTSTATNQEEPFEEEDLEINYIRRGHFNGEEVLCVCGQKGFIALYNVHSPETTPIILRSGKRNSSLYSNTALTEEEFYEDTSTWSVSASHNFVVSGSNTHRVAIFDRTGRLRGEIEGCHHNVPSVDISNDEKYIAAACIDRKVRIWKNLLAHHEEEQRPNNVAAHLTATPQQNTPTPNSTILQKNAAPAGTCPSTSGPTSAARPEISSLTQVVAISRPSRQWGWLVRFISSINFTVLPDDDIFWKMAPQRDESILQTNFVDASDVEESTSEDDATGSVRPRFPRHTRSAHREDEEQSLMDDETEDEILGEVHSPISSEGGASSPGTAFSNVDEPFRTSASSEDSSPFIDNVSEGGAHSSSSLIQQQQHSATQSVHQPSSSRDDAPSITSSPDENISTWTHVPSSEHEDGSYSIVTIKSEEQLQLSHLNKNTEFLLYADRTTLHLLSPSLKVLDEFVYRPNRLPPFPLFQGLSRLVFVEYVSRFNLILLASQTDFCVLLLRIVRNQSGTKFRLIEERILNLEEHSLPICGMAVHESLHEETREEQPFNNTSVSSSVPPGGKDRVYVYTLHVDRTLRAHCIERCQGSDNFNVESFLV